jgi:soluble lytic murein transglycosylase-like protein
MPDLASQIVASKMQQLNTRLNSKMQEISGKTGIQFSEMFASRIDGYSQEQDEFAEINAGDTEVAGETLSVGSVAARGNYDALITAMAHRHGVEPQLARAVVWAESNFNPNVVSHKGAVGLMQLMPATAASLGVTDSFDPIQNIDGGVRYLAARLQQYDGDVLRALAAYNCGQTRLANLGITDLKDPAQFALLPRETQNYITRIEGYLETMGMSGIL